MSFFKASKKAEDVRQGGTNHIVRSGAYEVVIKAPVVSVSSGGSKSVDLFVDHQGQQQMVYGGLRVTNNDGSQNKIGAKIFNQLVIIADLEDVADPVDITLPIGKGGADKEVAALEDLAEMPVIMRIQMEYGIYRGNIQERKVIKSFFRVGDHASAEEIVNEKDFGSAWEREQKYLDHVTYKDGLDETAVAAWIAAGRPEGTGGKTSSPAGEKNPPFGNKRFGDKNAA